MPMRVQFSPSLILSRRESKVEFLVVLLNLLLSSLSEMLRTILKVSLLSSNLTNEKFLVAFSLTNKQERVLGEVFNTVHLPGIFDILKVFWSVDFVRLNCLNLSSVVFVTLVITSKNYNF